MNSSNDSLAMQRITKLVDENSFMEIGSLVTARNTDFNLADTDTPISTYLKRKHHLMVLLPVMA